MTAFPTAPAPHGPHARPVGWVMTQVLLALVPGALTALAVRGPGVAVNLALCLGTAYLCEAGALRLRNRPLGPALRDGSVAVTGVLIALA
ncbi:MAG: RnfABCDGE type electron transport complex subunit D, partial [Candidatus Macondimonas sp.]